MRKAIHAKEVSYLDLKGHLSIDPWSAKKPQEKSGEELAFSQSYHFVKRKKQIVFQRIIPDTLCLCEIYENSALIARIR